MNHIHHMLIVWEYCRNFLWGRALW